MFQRLEDSRSFEDGVMPFKCHIMGKGPYKNMAMNENNFIAATNKLHEYFDGINGIVKKLPAIVVE